MLRTRKNGRNDWMLKMAVAAVPVLAALATTPARGQFRTGNDGRARDANNRVGSNGYNDAGSQGSAVTPNQIVNGNVTGGKEFHGPTASTDARAFRGPSSAVQSSFGIASGAGSVSDRFIAGSSGAPTRTTANLSNTYTPLPFYGDSRAVPPPSGFAPLSYSGGYTSATAPGQFTDALNPYRIGGPLTQPNFNSFGSRDTGEGLSPRPALGTTVLQSATSGDNRVPNLLLVSPLSGIQDVPASAADDYFQSLSHANALDRTNPADRNGINGRMTVADLRREIETGAPGANAQKGQPGQLGNGQLDNGQPNGPKLAPGRLPGALPAPLESPANGTLQSGQLDSSLNSGALPGNLQDRQQAGRRTLLTPSQQDSQYSELEKRLKRYRTGDESEAADANRTSPQPANPARGAGPGRPGAPGGTPGAPGTAAQPGGALPPPGGVGPGAIPAPGSLPGALPAPGALPRPIPQPAPGDRPAPGTVRPGATQPAAVRPGGARPPGPLPEPLDIKSLAAGVQARGLSQVLRTAEDLMKKKKFAAALDQYDLAEQVAPNNPLIFVGKANAELGASSYRNAESHIRQAFAAEPALLLARYDLNAFLGQDRVQVLTKDLGELSRNNPAEGMAPFLLAYISYNNGNTAQASAFLAEAERRGGRPDPVIRQIRKYWSISAPPRSDAPARPDLNK